MRILDSSRLYFAVGVLTALLLSVCDVSADVEPTQNALTLTQAIAVAEKNSPYLRIAEENYYRAVGARREAAGATGPSLVVAGQYTRNDKVDEVVLGDPTDPATVKTTVGQLTTKAARATLNQPIDISGILKAGADAARFSELAAKLDFDASRQQLMLDVRTRYLGVILARDREKVAGESVARLREYLRLAQVRLDSGASPKFDVLRAKTELANAEQQQIAAQNGVAIAELGLANVMGVRHQPGLILVAPELKDKQLPSKDELVDKALKIRPDHLSLEAGLEAAKKGVIIAQRGLRPGMSIDGNYNWNGSTTLFQPRKFSWNAVLSVSIPIFDNGVTKGRVDQAKAAVGSAEASRDLSAQRVRLEVETAQSALDTSRKRLAAAASNVEEAKEALRLAQLRYENGEGPPIEVTDAQLALTLAENNLVEARFDVFLAYSQMARAVGDPSIALD